MTTALVPGSFDPFHTGHLRIVEWAARTYDDVVVAVLGNPEKPTGLLPPAERVRLIELSVAHLPNVRCTTARGTTGDVARQESAAVIVRSAHKEADLERSLAVLNKFLSGGVPTVHPPEDPETAGHSSTKVRVLLAMGDATGAAALVPEPAREALLRAERLPPQPHRPGGGSGGPGPMTAERPVQPLRAVAVPVSPADLDRDDALDRVLGLLEAAAAGGADLIVLPEAVLPGYPAWVHDTVPSGPQFEARYAELFDRAVVVGSAVTQVLAVAARRFEAYLSVGVVERDPRSSALHSTQLLVSPEGMTVSTHRKVLVPGAERLLFEPGDGAGLRAVDTPFGRVATLLRGELLDPLARAALAQQGVDVLVAPAWRAGDIAAGTLAHVAGELGVVMVAAAADLASLAAPGADPVAGSEAPVAATLDVNAARRGRHRPSRPDLFHLGVELPER